VISNHLPSVNRFMKLLENNLLNMGIKLSTNKTLYIQRISKKINFYYLGFEFIVIPRERSQNYFLFSNRENLYNLHQLNQRFRIILRPRLSKFKEIKEKIRKVIFRIHNTPRNKLYKIFIQINFIVLS